MVGLKKGTKTAFGRTHPPSRPIIFNILPRNVLSSLAALIFSVHFTSPSSPCSLSFTYSVSSKPEFLAVICSSRSAFQSPIASILGRVFATLPSTFQHFTKNKEHPHLRFSFMTTGKRRNGVLNFLSSSGLHSIFLSILHVGLAQETLSQSLHNLQHRAPLIVTSLHLQFHPVSFRLAFLVSVNIITAKWRTPSQQT